MVKPEGDACGVERHTVAGEEHIGRRERSFENPGRERLVEPELDPLQWCDPLRDDRRVGTEGMRRVWIVGRHADPVQQ